MDGLLNINKPAGMTSHDVVGKVRRVCQTKRAGHAGTLDPDATGVLVVAVGQATRFLPHLLLEPKCYRARLLIGVSTNTEDASGTVESEADASHVTEADVRAVLPQFTGTILQVPPMVSALHHEGRRLHELAREGITVERAPRPVVIHEITLTDFAPGTRAEATLEVICGGGTYIRTLCKDIGAALNPALPAHMKTLIRRGVGPYLLENAVALDDLTTDAARAALLPMENALPFPAVDVDDINAANVRLGRSIPASQKFSPDAEVTLLHNGTLLALAWYADEMLHPFKVFAANGESAAP